jgi:hypothetical protein
VAVSFIGGGNQSTRRKPPTCLNSLTNADCEVYYIPHYIIKCVSAFVAAFLLDKLSERIQQNYCWKWPTTTIILRISIDGSNFCKWLYHKRWKTGINIRCGVVNTTLPYQIKDIIILYYLVFIYILH